MTLENEERFLLLASSYSFYLKHLEPTKAEVLDKIADSDWIIYNATDLTLRENRNELLWRNEFAFVRKHLETKGFYVSGIINNWGITENGIKHLKELLQEVNKTNLFSKISQKAVIEVNSMLSKSESISEEEIKAIDNLPNIDGKEKMALVKIRINQGTIKKRALKLYNSKCLLCGLTHNEVLIASHIKSWANSNKEEKGDLNNILLLCPNHDKVFDSGLISFDDDGNIIISEELSAENRLFLNLRGDMKIPLTEKNKKYLAYHRSSLFRK